MPQEAAVAGDANTLPSVSSTINQEVLGLVNLQITAASTRSHLINGGTGGRSFSLP